MAQSPTEQCGGSSSGWMKFCSSVSGNQKSTEALKVVQLKGEEMLEKQVARLHQTLPRTALGVLQVHGYSLKLESATQRTQNAAQTLQQTRFPFPRRRVNAVPQADRRFENQSWTPDNFVQIPAPARVNKPFLFSLSRLPVSGGSSEYPQTQHCICLWAASPWCCWTVSKARSNLHASIFVTDYSSTVLIRYSLLLWYPGKQ